MRRRPARPAPDPATGVTGAIPVHRWLRRPSRGVPCRCDGGRAVARTDSRIATRWPKRHRALVISRSSASRSSRAPPRRRLAPSWKAITGVRVPTGALDITLYRDDLMRSQVGPQPILRRTDIDFSIDDRRILLVDDVLYTGRTIRAALDALIDFGRPRAIELVVLVDRGHRELPIKADYVGRTVPTSPDESVQVRLDEVEGRDEVVIER